MLSSIDIKKGIMIYGTGIVGQSVYMKLCLLGLRNAIKGFITSQKETQEYCMGVKIYSLEELLIEPTIIISVMNKHLNTILENLINKNFKNYIYAEQILDEECKCLIEGFELQDKQLEYCENENTSHNSGKSALHVTYPMQGNAGDTMLSKCVRQIFREHFKIINWDICKVSDRVEERTIQKINNKDVCIIGGGGLFLPDTNENNISGWQWGISKNNLFNINIPVIVYAVGYNYFKGQKRTELFEQNIISLVNKAQFIGLRNQGSVSVIKEILPDSLKEKILYQPCPTTLISKLFTLPKKIVNKKIAVNIAFDRLEKRLGENTVLILDEISQAIKEISIMGYEIILVLHCNSDSIFSIFLNNRNVKYKIVNLSYALPNEIIQFYSNIELTIGMRGHSQMIPFGVHCRILSLGTHEKMKWFLQDIEAEDWYIDVTMDIQNLKTNIVENFKQINENLSKDTDYRMKMQQEKLWRITMENNHLIEEIIR